MPAMSPYIAFGASRIFTFDGCGISNKLRDVALVAAINDLRPGEILRFFIDHNPFSLIRSLVLRYGSKIELQYLERQQGSVVIDFRRVRE